MAADRHFWALTGGDVDLPKPLWIEDGPACVVYTNREGFARDPRVVPFYRFYHGKRRQHFWSCDPNDPFPHDNGFGLEFPACYLFPSQAEGTVPFYRWRNNDDELFLWTTDPNGEKLPKPAYFRERVAGYVFPETHPIGNGLDYFHRWFKTAPDPAPPPVGDPYCVMIYGPYIAAVGRASIIERITIYATSDEEADARGVELTGQVGGSGCGVSRGQCR